MRNPRIRAFDSLLVALLIAVAAISGCTSSGSTTPDQSEPAKRAGSVVEFIQQELQSRDLSDFEREVLQRAVDAGRIPLADYNEAFDRYATCMSGLGYTVSWAKEPTGLNRITSISPLPQDQASSARLVAAEQSCAAGRLAVIEGLFGLQQNNPDLYADPRIVAIQCLLKAGLIEQSYTPNDFEKDYESGFAYAPFDVMDPVANSCLYGAGYAIGVTR